MRSKIGASTPTQAPTWSASVDRFNGTPSGRSAGPTVERLMLAELLEQDHRHARLGPAQPRG